MTNHPDPEATGPAGTRLPSALVEYAERLLLGTGLDVSHAVLITTGQLDSPVELRGLASALRAGWQASESLA